MTIEERATIHAVESCDGFAFPKGTIYNKIREAYVQGATEQKAIDDAKYKKLRDLAYAMYTNAQYLTNDASGLRQSMRNFYHYINFEEE